MINSNKKYFTTQLLKWYNPADRPMPWKGIKDPYKIWIAEIVLQQTRVAQGLPYYEKLIKKYSTVQKLAAAKEEELMMQWQGLGYYSRARNMHHAAKHIVTELKGNLPADYEGWIKLKGVGEYTAAAISSFAFNERKAVVDGNVYRVLSRFFGIKNSIDEPESKKIFKQLASQLMDVLNPGVYNQAIMDFGATICTPAIPDCKHCVLQKKCFAFQNNMIAALPVRSKKLKIKQRFFHYFIINYKDQLLIRERKDKDIWKGLYDFPLIEMQSLTSIPELKKSIEWNQLFGSKKILIEFVKDEKQQLTHQQINLRFISINIKRQKDFEILSENFIKTSKKGIKKFPFPKTLVSFIKHIH